MGGFASSPHLPRSPLSGTTPPPSRSHAAGVDPNDLDKMNTTLRFFEQVLMAMPIADAPWGADSSNAAEVADDKLGALGLNQRALLVSKLQDADEFDAVAALEAQELAAEDLARLMPEFAQLLLEQMLKALDHLEKIPKKRSADQAIPSPHRFWLFRSRSGLARSGFPDPTPPATHHSPPSAHWPAHSPVRPAPALHPPARPSSILLRTPSLPATLPCRCPSACFFSSGG